MTIEMKKNLKLNKYGFLFKTNCFSGGFITLLGLVLLVLAPSRHFNSSSSLYLLGAFYLLHGPMSMLQTQYSLLYAGAVKSSPKARMLEIAGMDYMSAIIALVGYTLIIAYTSIRYLLSPEGLHAIYPLVVGLVSILLLISWGIAYKTFIAGIVFLFISTIVAFTLSSMLVETELGANFSNNIAVNIALGYLCVFVGIFLAGVLRRILYKHPFSKLAGGSKLRKQL